VLRDALHVHGTSARYGWTLIGTNTGPGGTGRAVLAAVANREVVQALIVPG